MHQCDFGNQHRESNARLPGNDILLSGVDTMR